MFGVFMGFGGAAFVVAFLAAVAFARSGRRAVAVAATGPALLLVWATLIVITARDGPYHDEAEYFGVWINPLMFFVFGFNLAGWLTGAAAGYGARRRLFAAPSRGASRRSPRAPESVPTPPSRR